MTMTTETRLQASATMLVAIAVLQASFGPVSRSQSEPGPSRKGAAEQKKATNELNKPKWEQGKISSLQEMLVVQGPAHLLSAPALQEEVSLSKEQREKLARLEQEIKRRQREAITKIENPPLRWAKPWPLSWRRSAWGNGRRSIKSSPRHRNGGSWRSPSKLRDCSPSSGRRSRP